MPELGRKYTCYSCHTKFYDLGKPIPICPKCGADQREAEESRTPAPTRGRRVVEEPPVEEEFPEPEPAPTEPADEEEEEIISGTAEREEEPEEEEEEEEEEY